MEFGGSSPLRLFRPAIPNCCKLWFPMVETGGSRITDIVAGVVYEPTLLAYNIEHAVQIKSPAASAPLSGTMPTIGTKSFILFSVYTAQATEYGGGTIRPGSDVKLWTAGGGGIQHFDGDGAQISKEGGNLLAGVENGTGLTAQGLNIYVSGAVAAVRDAEQTSFGMWIHNSNLPNLGLDNVYAERGEMFGRLLRNENYVASQPDIPWPSTIYGNWDRNDYNLPDDIITRWQCYYGVSAVPCAPDGNPVTAPGMDRFDDGVPGIWAYSAPYDIQPFTTLAFGAYSVGDEVNWHGIALFVFDAGLPSDFKEALRWMRDQWIAGNKVIWPAWADL